ncbi:3-oxoacyl-[acyl-carrier protein] reductase [Jatrophihabitans endophyticus]|uniref:3-oxoacyl-[acyl-carrier protein] reductase n=1 Tax=Jatrophihabitans endophyticus TaxID=1206085 RepID=A0A1M5E471_9ACTN|nr:SDR family oxidoreductase [Jatrophihabitans endophyticus]SHF73872.1 3-oxoacyl-[acyl-carrier protein] reductase [Jatrophihabitans endophyticus]
MPTPVRSIADTVVSVTGASAGIGAASARLLAERGARVAVQARRRERLDELVDELGDDTVLPVPGDVQDPAAATELVAAAVERFGRLDSVVVNAGIGSYGGILDVDEDTLRTMMRTNIEGTVWAVRAAVAQFRAAGDGGDVVIVSSVAGLRGGADEAVYAATKFAQVGLAGALDREVRAEGIRVTTICPAGVETEFAIGAGRTAGDPALADYLRPEDVAHTIATVLEQPRRVRTTQWQLWSMGQGS